MFVDWLYNEYFLALIFSIVTEKLHFFRNYVIHKQDDDPWLKIALLCNVSFLSYFISLFFFFSSYLNFFSFPFFFFFFFFSVCFPTLLYCVIFYGNLLRKRIHVENKINSWESGGIFLAHVLTDLLLTRVMDSQGEKRNSTSPRCSISGLTSWVEDWGWNLVNFIFVPSGFFLFSFYSLYFDKCMKPIFILYVDFINFKLFINACSYQYSLSYDFSV